MGNLVKNGISYTGGSGASSYNELNDKPRINGTTLSGNKTLGDLGIATEINELDDVDISTPSNNDVLKYNATSGKWENGEGGSGGGGHTIEDVDGTDLTQRDTLQFGEGLLAEDDSTNEKTVVALDPMPSEDIDEVVDIYPQAGELVSIVNAFNRGDIYSTDEKMIGQWVDGKPIYQRVVELSSNVTITTSWTDIVAVDLTSCNLVDVTPVLYKDTSSTGLYSTTDTIWYFPTNRNGYIQAKMNSGSITVATGTAFILKYTKTTDVAISIGNENEYSTTEKVIGTWIDGKPLYQKTYQLTFGSITDNTNTTVSEDISSLNTEFCKVGEAQFIDADNGCSPISSWYSSNNFYFLRAWIANDGATKMLKISSNRQYYSNKPVFITIQYTKTSN